MTYTSYVPHGINSQLFFPITEESNIYKDYLDFKKQIKDNNKLEFIIFWNNRNVRRKQPGDVLLAYRAFCDKLPKEESKNVALIMHTDIIDPNGTDLMAVRKMVCPNYRVIFSNAKVDPIVMNFYYNLADVTMIMSSNEGFGLSGAESLMAGTPIVGNTTGGIQDYMRFEDDKGNWIDVNGQFPSNHTGKYKKCGNWAKPVFPSNRSLQGSPPTPYVFDDRADFRDVAEQLHRWYKIKPDSRLKRGLEGRQWMLSKESGMSAKEMGNRMKKSIDFILNNWKPRKRFELTKIENEPEIPKELSGIVWE